MKKYFTRIRKILYYSLFSWRYAEFHITSKIIKPIIITPKYISVGKYVQVYHHARIQCIVYDASEPPSVVINDGVSCQQNLHLTCANSILIEKNVAIAANVTITDINHDYKDITIPIEHQKWQVSDVIIGEGSKIYNNSVILPGTRIGRNTTVGANSVVSGKFPDYCVIAGAPAKVIKKFNIKTKNWDRV